MGIAVVLYSVPCLSSAEPTIETLVDGTQTRDSMACLNITKCLRINQHEQKIQVVSNIMVAVKLSIRHPKLLL